MSDEIRQLATAIQALAESNLGIGDVMREVLATQRQGMQDVVEALGRIEHQNSDILEHLGKSDDRHQGSERKIRTVERTVNDHGQRIAAIEATIGIPSGPADA